MNVFELIYMLYPGIELSDYQKQMLLEICDGRKEIQPGVQLLEFQRQILLSICGVRQELLLAPVDSVDDELLSINDIKNRLRYSKNPLEVKYLNRRLNLLYKQRKGSRHKHPL